MTSTIYDWLVLASGHPGVGVSNSRHRVMVTQADRQVRNQKRSGALGMIVLFSPQYRHVNS